MFIELLFCFLVTISFIIISKRLSKNLNFMIDIPNNRSSHTTPKPKSGGLGIFFAIILTIAVFNHRFIIDNIYFFISLLLIFFIGVIDDLVNASPKYKFLFITLSAFIMFFFADIKLDTLGEWFNINLSLPYILSIVLTVIMINGFTNAINLIDGLDGLAGGISLVILSSFLYLGIKFDDYFIIYISSVFISSLIAFLLFNWYPSRLFLGDSGSLVLGFTISVLSLKLLDYVNITTILFLLLIPIVDTLIVMIRRSIRKQSPFKADKSHIHHKIFKWKEKVDYSVFIIVFLQIVFSLIAFLTINQNNFLNLFIFLFVFILFFILFDERKKPRFDYLITYNIKLTNFILNKKNKVLIVILLLSVLLIFNK